MGGIMDLGPESDDFTIREEKRREEKRREEKRRVSALGLS
jgi:hypothetical protein